MMCSGSRVLVLSVVAVAVAAAVAGDVAAQPRPDLGTPVAAASRASASASASKPVAWPAACGKDVLKAARWFVRDLDDGGITVEDGPGRRAWRGTTTDDGQLLPVLWLAIEAIDPSSSSSGAVSGWIEIEGAPPGMQVTQLDPDTKDATLPDSHWTRSLGRWRLVRSLVDGTPKEHAVVAKAFDRCAAALTAPRKKPRRR
jgi:hypothetical protein